MTLVENIKIKSFDFLKHFIRQKLCINPKGVQTFHSTYKQFLIYVFVILCDEEHSFILYSQSSLVNHEFKKKSLMSGGLVK